MKRTLVGLGAAAAALVLSGCYGMVTNHDTTVATRCTKEVGTLAPGATLGDIVFTDTPLPDETLTVHVNAPDWSDASSTFPLGLSISGFSAPGVTAGQPVVATLLANDGLWSDPNAPATTDLSTDPNTVPFWALPFNAALPATPGDPVTYGSTAGGPYPMHFVKVYPTLGSSGVYEPVTISFNGISVSGSLVTLSDGTKTVTSVICTPTHAGQTDPAMITITPHTATSG